MKTGHNSAIILAVALMLLAGVTASSIADEPKRLPMSTADVQRVTAFLKTQPRNAVYGGHNASVMWLTFTPDGKTLASSSRDATILIWDMTIASQEKMPLQKKIRHHTQ